MNSIKGSVGDFFSYIGGKNNTIVMTPDQIANPDKASCKSKFFKKVKYSSLQEATRKYSDYYDTKLFSSNEDIILLQITVMQDSVKTINNRSSTKILDFIGDVGGFQQAMLMLFYMIGEYFSAKYLLKSIAETLYLKKNDDSGNVMKKDLIQDIEVEGGEQTIANMFSKIEINSLYLLVDPFMKCFCPLSKQMKLQRKILEQVDKRFLEELDVILLLEKLRDSYDLLSNMNKKKNRDFLQFNKTRVINPYQNNESRSSSDITSSDEEID